MAGKTIAFVRDDDFGDATPLLRTFVDEFVERRIPVNYLVIPQYLTAEGACLGRELRRSHPQLIRLNQHGYRHEQIVRGELRWSEFDGGRSYEDQLSDIARGKKILEDALDDAFDNQVFTPPAHKYDRNTVRALLAQGFRVLSASTFTSALARQYYRIGRAFRLTKLLGRRVSYHGRPPGRGRMLELSVAIDVDMEMDARGDFIEKSSAMLLREFERARGVHPVVGIMFHHATYENTRKLDTLREFMDELIADRGVEFQCLEDIAARIGEAPA